MPENIAVNDISEEFRFNKSNPILSALKFGSSIKMRKIAIKEMEIRSELCFICMKSDCDNSAIEIEITSIPRSFGVILRYNDSIRRTQNRNMTDKCILYKKGLSGSYHNRQGGEES